MNREEFLSRVAHSDALVLATGVEQVDLAVVVADDEAAICKPSVARVVVGIVLLSLSLVDEDGLDFHRGAIKFDVAVKLDSSHNDNGWIDWTEGDLLDRLAFRDVGDDVERTDAPLLVPVPDDDFGVGLGADRDQQTLVLATKVCRDELLRLVFVGAENFAFLERHVENRLLLLLDAQFEELSNVIHCADCVLAFLANGEELATWRESEGSDALTAFDAWNKPLHLLSHVVDDNIVAAWVANDVVVEVDDVVANVALETEEEARLHVHTAGVDILGGRRALASRVYLLRCVGSLHHVGCAWL